MLPFPDLLPDRVRPVAFEQHETLGLADGQAAPDQTVHDREESGVGADPQRQREDGDGREGRLLEQPPPGVAQIRREVLEPARPALVPARLLHLLDAAHRELCAPPRFGLGDSGRDEVRDVPLDVVGELGRELALQPPAVAKPPPPAHGASSGVARRMRPTASASFFQLVVSASSCVRPRRVRR